MVKYTVLAHSSTMNKVRAYKENVLLSKVETGFYLYKSLKGKDLSKISDKEFLEIIVNTKKPQIFAESSVKGDGSDWNLDELSILGDVSIATPVEIYDNAAHSKPLVYDKPFLGTLLFTPGALLRNDCRNTPADWNESVSNHNLNFEGYYNLYERRLLPVFHYVNSLSKERKAIISIPGLGCGMFAGEFRGALGKKLKQVLINFIEKHSSQFPNIKAVYYDPFKECSNERFEIKTISLLVRPLSQNNLGKSQLSKIETFEDIDKEFLGCSLFSIVAWDHVSWPGNDFYAGSRATDDGVKAAATSSMYSMTGVKGSYNPKENKYLPPETYYNWTEVITRNQLKINVIDNLQVF